MSKIYFELNQKPEEIRTANNIHYIKQAKIEIASALFLPLVDISWEEKFDIDKVLENGGVDPSSVRLSQH